MSLLFGRVFFFFAHSHYPLHLFILATPRGFWPLQKSSILPTPMSFWPLQKLKLLPTPMTFWPLQKLTLLPTPLFFGHSTKPCITHSTFGLPTPLTTFLATPKNDYPLQKIFGIQFTFLRRTWLGHSRI